MKEIELYDIITLDNDEEYTIVKILIENQKKYYLLAPVNEEEEPDLEKIKIVEEIIENGEILLDLVEDEKILATLSKKFLLSLRESLD